MSDISVVRKTTNDFTVKFNQNGQVQDITGWIVFFTVKKNTNQTDSEAIISKTISSHEDSSEGTTTINLSYSDTDISPGRYLYDIAYLDSEGNRGSSSPKNFIVEANVTQRNS